MTIASTVFWVSLCVYGESVGEIELGRKAVAHVVFNRAEKRNLTPEQVVKEKLQFSSFNNGPPRVTDYASFIRCVESVLEVMQERLEGNKFGSVDHFYASDGDYRIDPPKWIKDMQFVEKIGNHSFFKS